MRKRVQLKFSGEASERLLFVCQILQQTPEQFFYGILDVQYTVIQDAIRKRLPERSDGADTVQRGDKPADSGGDRATGAAPLEGGV